MYTLIVHDGCFLCVFLLLNEPNFQHFKIAPERMVHFVCLVLQRGKKRFGNYFICLLVLIKTGNIQPFSCVCCALFAVCFVSQPSADTVAVCMTYKLC